jgi:membrane AbrB-like protein
MPAGALLLPMGLATVLQDLGLLRIELPHALLAASYVVVGWALGLRFTADTFRQAARALPQVLGAIAMLLVACAGIGWALSRIAHLDLLTAYFATSPGGADSIAIIASGTSVDVPFVMAIQVCRFLAVLLFGPPLARRAAQLTGSLGESP